MLYVTHIVPMKLQQLDTAAQPSAPLLHAPKDVFSRYGLPDRTE